MEKNPDTNLPPLPVPRSPPPHSVGSRHELSPPLQLSPVLSHEQAANCVGWEPIGEQPRFYDEQDFLRPGSNLTSQKLRNRKADDVVGFDYPLDLDYLGDVGEYPPDEEGDLSPGFSEDNDIFFRVSKDRLIDSKEFNQIINPTKEPRLRRSRMPQLGIMWVYCPRIYLVTTHLCYEQFCAACSMLSPTRVEFALYRLIFHGFSSRDFPQCYDIYVSCCVANQ